MSEQNNGGPVALFDWRLDVECPECEGEIDLVKYDADFKDNTISSRIFNNDWDALKGVHVQCPVCKHKFTLGGVEY